MEPKPRELPDALTIPFVICDNTLNRKGWRLNVEGIDMSGFLKNPVCLYQHDTYSVPVGRWLNMRVEGTELKGDAEFDRNDPDAVKLFWKYKDGYMNAVSLHIMPIEESELPEQLVPGQKYATVTRSELLEVSLVSVPGQKNAVKLSSTEGKEYRLSVLKEEEQTPQKMEKKPKTVEELQAEAESLKKTAVRNLLALHEMRGVVSADEMPHLQLLAEQNYEGVAALLGARKPAGNNTQSPDAKSLVALHVQRGAIPATEAGLWQQFAEKEYENARLLLETKTGRDNAAQFIQQIGAMTDGKEGREGWTYLDYFKKDPAALERMAIEAPEKLKKLEMAFEAESRVLGCVTTKEA